MEENRFQPVAVRNRDIPLLAEVLSIMQDIRMSEARQEWQHERLTNITRYLTGMPGGGGTPKGLEEAFATLSEMEEDEAKKCREYQTRLNRAEKIVNGIQNQTMRTFVKMKYMFDASDAEIRKELNMTRRGFDQARKCVEDAPNMAAVRWQEKYVAAPKGYAAKKG